MNQDERWLPIDIPGYEISNHGRLKSLPRKGTAGGIIKQHFHHKGYLEVTLGGKRLSRKIHSLVAIAFLGPRPLKHQVNHKDTDKANNRVTNLEWVTPSENIRHAYANDLINFHGVRNPSAKLTEQQVEAIRAAKGTPHKDIAQQFGVSVYTIRAILYNRIWKTYD